MGKSIGPMKATRAGAGTPPSAGRRPGPAKRRGGRAPHSSSTIGFQSAIPRRVALQPASASPTAPSMRWVNSAGNPMPANGNPSFRASAMGFSPDCPNQMPSQQDARRWKKNRRQDRRRHEETQRSSRSAGGLAAGSLQVISAEMLTLGKLKRALPESILKHRLPTARAKLAGLDVQPFHGVAGGHHAAPVGAVAQAEGVA